jgi:hypothetical protein
MSGFATDLRDAARALIRRPGFSLTVVLTLSLGIGATTTVYAFVHALLIRPYPYAEPDRLVRLQTVATKEGLRRGASLLDIDDYRRRGTRIADLGAYTVFSTRLLTDGPPQVVSMAQLNPQALAVLGVPPAHGRLLLPEEDLPGGDVNKAVISHDVWQTVFGGRSVIGQPLRTDRVTYTIVGIMPPGFAFPDNVGVWSPMESYYSNLAQDDDRRVKWRGARWYATVARLKPGVSLAEAEQDLNAVAAALDREYPKTNEGIRVALTELRAFEVGPIRPYLLPCRSRSCGDGSSSRPMPPARNRSS